jgi:hypothetical protein
MSYESYVKTWQRLRDKHHNDPQAQAMVRQFGVEIAMQRVADVFHTSFVAAITIENARRGRQAPRDAPSE